MLAVVELAHIPALADNVVNAPVLAVALPIGVALIALAWVRPSSTLPVTLTVVKNALAGVTLPITVLCISRAYKLAPIPAPPVTINAPVLLFVALVVLTKNKLPALIGS